MIKERFEKKDKMYGKISLNNRPHEAFNYYCIWTGILYILVCLCVSFLFRVLGISDWIIDRPIIRTIAFVSSGIVLVFLAAVHKDIKTKILSTEITNFALYPIIASMTCLFDEVYWLFFILIIVVSLFNSIVNGKIDHETYAGILLAACIVSFVVYILVAIFYIGFSYNNMFDLFVGGYLLLAFILGWERILIVAYSLFDLYEIRKGVPLWKNNSDLVTYCYSHPCSSGYLFARNIFLKSFFFMGETLQEADTDYIKKK